MAKYHFLCCENSVKLFCRRFRAACGVAAQNRSCGWVGVLHVALHFSSCVMHVTIPHVQLNLDTSHFG